MNYILICYKPSSDDYCRGCHMASYSDDFKSFGLLTREKLIEKWAEFKSKEMRINEVGYSFQVYYKGFRVFDDTQENEDFHLQDEDEYDKYEEEFKKIDSESDIDKIRMEVEDAAEIAREAERQRKEKAEEMLRKQKDQQRNETELAEYKRLRKKFD